jgi:hypothetical protein
MFKLPALPSSQAGIAELCDLAELVGWEQGAVSMRELLAYLGRIDENDFNEGCEDDESQNAELLDDVMLELERRADACGGGYPFELEMAGTVLKHNDGGEPDKAVYRYLLLSTRLNMKAAKTHAGIDGTKLLEELSATVLREYLGERSEAMVFGTSADDGGFVERISTLCDRLGEGIGFRALARASGNIKAQDDKLDTVAWVPFVDHLPGQIIVFAQCKTGSNWRSLVSQLQPNEFIKRWFREPVLVDPVRAFCVSEAEDRTEWSDKSIYAGILFDRCRIVSLSRNVGVDDIVKWTVAAFKSFNLTGTP